ncbi:MAG: hypothetical protein CMJ45_10685 [Planctomyces sp.]|nr:hypothetical protein [Planctomyces sp.]
MVPRGTFYFVGVDREVRMNDEEADSLIAKLKATIGKEVVFQAPDELGRASFRQYALAIGDFNPLYSDRGLAQAHGLRDVMAPPTLICDTWQFVDSDFDETGRQSALKDELEMGGLRAGNSYEFFQPVHPDDIVSARRKTKNVYEKIGRSGRLLFCEIETSYSNQRNELLATNVETMFLRL